MKINEERINQIVTGNNVSRELVKAYLEQIAADRKAIDGAYIASLESFTKRATELIEMEKAMREHLELVNRGLIDKACEWLKENADNYYNSSCQADNCYFDSQQMLEDFREAMEE